MTDENGPEVKDVEVVHVEPAGGEDVEDGSEDDSSHPEGEAEGAAAPEEGEAAKPEVGEKKPAVGAAGAENTAESVSEDDLKEIPNETPRERALRLEVTRLKRAGRGERVSDLLGTTKPPEVAPAKKPEVSPKAQEILKKFKPEDVKNFKDILEVAAEELGFVRKDQMAATSYEEKGQEQLDAFLVAHPEYLPENDPDGLLWGQFKSEYGLYKPPVNPKEFSRLFNKVHASVFNIKPATAEGKGKINAAQKKIQVASHAGASNSSGSRTAARPVSRGGLRLDALKGFSDEDIAAMQGQ